MSNIDFSSLGTTATAADDFRLLIKDPGVSGTSGILTISANDFIALITNLITDKVLRIAETSSGTGASGQAAIYVDSVSHALRVSEDNGAFHDVLLSGKTGQTIASPTISAPTIASSDFANAVHNHSDAAHGGGLNSTGVSAGTYRSANITVAADGRLSSAATGENGPVVVLTDAATITTDASLGTFFRVPLGTTGGTSKTLAVPTSPTDGQIAAWEFVQPSSGGPITLSLATGTGGFAFGTDITSITLSTPADKRDLLTCFYCSSRARWFVAGFVKGF